MKILAMVLLQVMAASLLSLILAGCGAKLITQPSQILEAADSDNCLQVQGASTAAGANLQLAACADGKRSQEWLFTRIPSSQYQTVMNENSNLCMSAAGPATGPGAAVIQAPCSDSDPTVLWTIEPAPTGSSQEGWGFVNRASGQCLALPGDSLAAPTSMPLQQYACSASDPAQVWSVNFVRAGNAP